MRQADPFYWQERAEAQLRLARSAADDRAVRAHSLLAGYYFDRAFGAREKEAARASESLVHPLDGLVQLSA